MRKPHPLFRPIDTSAEDNVWVIKPQLTFSDFNLGRVFNREDASIALYCSCSFRVTKWILVCRSADAGWPIVIRIIPDRSSETMTRLSFLKISRTATKPLVSFDGGRTSARGNGSDSPSLVLQAVE